MSAHDCRSLASPASIPATSTMSTTDQVSSRLGLRISSFATLSLPRTRKVVAGGTGRAMARVIGKRTRSTSMSTHDRSYRLDTNVGPGIWELQRRSISPKSPNMSITSSSCTAMGSTSGLRRLGSSLKMEETASFNEAQRTGLSSSDTLRFT